MILDEIKEGMVLNIGEGKTATVENLGGLLHIKGYTLQYWAERGLLELNHDKKA